MTKQRLADPESVVPLQASGEIIRTSAPAYTAFITPRTMVSEHVFSASEWKFHAYKLSSLSLRLFLLTNITHQRHLFSFSPVSQALGFAAPLVNHRAACKMPRGRTATESADVTWECQHLTWAYDGGAEADGYAD